MQELSKNEMLNIEGGAVNTLPNVELPAKILLFIIKTIRSWF